MNFVKTNRMKCFEFQREKNLTSCTRLYLLYFYSGGTHLKKFTKTNDNRTVVDTMFVLVVGVSLFRIIRADIVYDGAQF